MKNDELLKILRKSVFLSEFQFSRQFKELMKKQKVKIFMKKEINVKWSEK